MGSPLAAIQMDPFSALNPKGDSTYLLGLEAQRRGYALFCYTPDKLSFEDGRVTAHGQFTTFQEDMNNWYSTKPPETLDLSTATVLLVRQDPPFDMAYITTTYLLEKLQGSTLVVNNPKSVRDCPEKWFVSDFPDFIPPTLISADKQALAEFRARHQDIVLKPLYGHGGNAVFRLKAHDGNFGAIVDHMLQLNKEPIIAQKFLPDVAAGDLRVILADGVVAGVVGRIPAADEIRSNFRVGGTAAKAELTPRQQEICDVVGTELKARGLIFVGLDLIGDYLTEINVTSPTGLRNVRDVSGVKPERAIWDAIEARLA